MALAAGWAARRSRKRLRASSHSGRLSGLSRNYNPVIRLSPPACTHVSTAFSTGPVAGGGGYDNKVSVPTWGGGIHRVFPVTRKAPTSRVGFSPFGIRERGIVGNES